MRAPSVVGMILASLALGCSPSIRMVEQSNTYFERCHAADRDPEVSDGHRLACWEAWLDHYTDGQSVEKVRHARERVEALVLAMHEPAPPSPPDAGAAAIAPPTADAGVVTVRASGCPARPRAQPGVACPSPPDDAQGPCADVCNPRWYLCVGRCPAYERRCLDACKAEHRTCMAGCF